MHAEIDMLEVGRVAEPAPNTSYTWNRAHFGAWCIVSSPLILGLDVTDHALVDSVWDIVSNEEAIAVNQVWAGHPGRFLRGTDKYQIWAKKLPGGVQAPHALPNGVDGL